jgi:peptide chain release factor 1
MAENDLIPWDTIRKRFNELNQQVSSSTLEANKRHLVQKELSFLTTLLAKHDEIHSLTAWFDQITSFLEADSDSEMAPLYEEELILVAGKIAQAKEDIDRLMFPPDPLDARDAFLEIRAGAGGQEASLFANDLLRMYTNYALKKHWRVDIVSVSETDVGGVREIVLHVQGKDVYGHLKYESGVHRVQRVPVTEASGRVHTSTATVAVMPEAKEVDISINPTDLRIDVYRSGGAGGQHVNTTDSAVRITHIPTGVVVTCQDERSQHKNKAKALKMLQSRLLVAQREKETQEKSLMRKELVGGGMRAEKVRTYNFPQNRITDHQVELTLNKLDRVLEGDLDEIVQALCEKDALERRKQPLMVVNA